MNKFILVCTKRGLGFCKISTATDDKRPHPVCMDPSSAFVLCCIIHAAQYHTTCFRVIDERILTFNSKQIFLNNPVFRILVIGKKYIQAVLIFLEMTLMKNTRRAFTVIIILSNSTVQQSNENYTWTNTNCS